MTSNKSKSVSLMLTMALLMPIFPSFSAAHTLVACPCYSAVFDFTPTEPDELHFSADEPIKVLEECTDGWMLGVKWHVLQQQPEKTAFVIGQEIGWFPGNYCAVADRSSSRKGSSDSQSHSQEEQEDRQGEGQGQAECDDDIELASSHDDDDDDEYLELDSSIDTEALIGHLVSEIVESVQEDHELVSALQEADDDYVSIGSQNEDNGEEVQEEEVAQEPQQDAHAQYDNPRAQSLHQTNPNPKPSPKHKPLRKQTSLSTHDLNKATSRQLGSAKRLPSRRASRESIYYFAVRSSLSELGPLQRPQCIEEEAVRATPSPPPALVAATPMSPPSSPSSQGRGRQSMTSDCMYASPQDAIVHENEEEKEDDDDLPALYPVAEEDSHTGATLAPRHSAIVQDPFRASDNYDNVREGRILAHKDSGLPQKSSKISLLAKISNSSAEDQNQVSKANRVVIAKYDCQAEDDDELEFVRGDVLIVTFRTEEDDWWKGYLQKDDSQTIKMIPKMFVRDLNEFEVQFFSSIKKKSSEKLLKMIQNKLPSRSASQRELTIVSETSRGARSSSQATEHVPAAAAPASPSSAVASPGPALHLYEDLDTTRESFCLKSMLLLFADVSSGQSVRRTPRPGRPAPPPPRGSKVILPLCFCLFISLIQRRRSQCSLLLRLQLQSQSSRPDPNRAPPRPCQSARPQSAHVLRNRLHPQSPPPHLRLFPSHSPCRGGGAPASGSAGATNTVLTRLHCPML